MTGRPPGVFLRLQWIRIAGIALLLHWQVHPDLLLIACSLNHVAFTTEASRDILYMAASPVISVVATHNNGSDRPRTVSQAEDPPEANFARDRVAFG